MGARARTVPFSYLVLYYCMLVRYKEGWTLASIRIFPVVSTASFVMSWL